MKIDKYRRFFPICQNTVFLNNAEQSPLNNCVKEKLDEYFNLYTHTPQEKPSPRKLLPQQLASMFGGSQNEYALVTSTGMGIGTIAAGIDWNRGDNIVLPVDEHRNNTYPWLWLKKKGVDVRLVPLEKDQRVNPHKIDELVDSRTKVLAVTSVRFDTGFRSDLKLLSQIAHNKNALLVVDGIQGAGTFPINVEKDGIDALACGGFKWLLGNHGTGFLYVKKEIQDKVKPVIPGMFSAENHPRDLVFNNDARRYETGSLPYSLFYAWTAGLELLSKIGIDNIHKQILFLTDRLIVGLKKKNIQIISPVNHINERSAILSVSLGSEDLNQKACQKLMGHNIIVALREGKIRISPNFFNNEEDIDKLLQII